MFISFPSESETKVKPNTRLNSASITSQKYHPLFTLSWLPFVFVLSPPPERAWSGPVPHQGSVWQACGWQWQPIHQLSSLPLWHQGTLQTDLPVPPVLPLQAFKLGGYFIECVYTGVNITILVSYSGEYLFRKGDSSFSTQLLTHSSVFCSTFFFYQTAAAWPRSVWISHKRDAAISWFCPVPQCVRGAQHTQRTWAHISMRLSLVSSHGTSWHHEKKQFSSAPAPFAFSLQVANAKVAAQCINFFPISRKLR